MPYAFSYKSSSSATPVFYYYVTNLQGDVVKILTASGAVVANYSYNAWGKLLSSSGTMASVNPIRYRGYYFDAETGFYYLVSRYYDPQICRFVNVDSQLDSEANFVGCNVFVYCANNPVLRVDPTGCFIKNIIKIVDFVIDAFQFYRNDDKKVKAVDNEDGTIKIKNSANIKTRTARLGYSFYLNHFSEFKDVIKGSSYGVEFEWKVHNIMFDITDSAERIGISNPKIKRIKDSSYEADIGSTIYADSHGPKSILMQAMYFMVMRLPAEIDLAISLFQHG